MRRNKDAGGIRSDRADWTHLRRLVITNRRRVSALASLSLLSGAVEAAFLVIVTRVGLAVAGGKTTTGVFAGVSLSVGTALGFAALLLAVRLVASLLSVDLSTSLSTETLTGLRQSLADSFLDASWSVQQAEPRGRLQQLTTTVANGAVGVIQAFTSMVSAMLNLVALMLVAVVVNPVATALVVVALTGLGALLSPIRVRIRLRSRHANRVAMELANSVAELGALGLEMHAFGVRTEMGDRINSLLRSEAAARRKAALLGGVLSPTYTTLAFGAILVGLAFARLVDVGELSAVGAVMLVMLRGLGYGQQFQSASGALAVALPQLEMVDEMLVKYRAAKVVGDKVPVSTSGQIEFRNVCFDYDDGHRALRHVTFEVPPGEVIGIVGPSGAGKSTIIQLLLGVRATTSGSVLVDGQEVSLIDRHALGEVMAFVPQDARLFTGTISDNVRFFRSRITEAGIVSACEQAGLFRDAARLAHGLDTSVGQAGSQLSGGQRQRVAIARALAGSPKVLVLDEPTSALDVESERLIKDVLGALSGTVTVVVVAHRMTTLEMCSRILVVEEGEISGFDRPEVLVQSNDFYRRAVGAAQRD